MLAGLDSLFKSRNSDIGFRFAKRDAIGCDVTLLKRSPKLSREVRASRGMLILAILQCSEGKDVGPVDGKRRLDFWKIEKTKLFGNCWVSIKGRSASQPLYAHIPQ